MGTGLQELEVLINAGQYLIGLVKKDAEQFGIDFLARGLRELQGFGRWLWRFRSLWLERSHCFVDLLARVTTGSESREDVLCLLPELLVGDQIGIFLQRGEILLHFLAQTGVCGLLLECRQQAMRFTLLLLQFLLDRRRRCVGGRLAGVAGLHFADKALEVGGAVVQCVDEETDQRETIRHTGKIGLLRDIVGCRESFDVSRALAENCRCTIVPHHRQGTDDLSQRSLQTIQVGGLLGIAKEPVENLFDLCQIVLNFPGHLPDQQLFMRQAGHFVERRDLRLRLRRRSGNAATEPIDHDVNLVRKTPVEVLYVFLSVLREEDRRGGFHGQRFVVPCRCLSEQAGHFANGLYQSTIVGVVEFVDQCRQGAGVGAKCG